MSLNDQRSVSQVQKLDTPQQINEALRKISASITKLEGRQGQIILRDGFNSTSSTATAAQFTSEILAASDFGIFFTGVEGSDCWLVSGAKLAPSNEWVALKTRAAFLKLSNIGGPQFYFNTDLVIGTSFIPLIQSSTTTTPHWGIWQSSVPSVSYGPELVTWDSELFADPLYFVRQSANTEIKILIDGVYEASVVCTNYADDTTVNQEEVILNLGSLSVAGTSYFPSTVGSTYLATEYPNAIWSVAANEVVSVNRFVGAPDGAALDRQLSIKLLQS